MIRRADRELKAAWRERFAALPQGARIALRDALLELRADAAKRGAYAWDKNKYQVAAYWKVLSVYSGHLARAIPVSPDPLPFPPRASSPSARHPSDARPRP